MRYAESYALLRKQLLRFIRPATSNIYNVYYEKVIKLLTKLRVLFIHFKKQIST